MNTFDPFMPASPTNSGHELAWPNLFTVHMPSSLYRLSPLYPPPPPLPFVSIDNYLHNNSTTVNNFSCKHSFDYHGFPYDASMPEDLYPEGSQERLLYSFLDDLLNDSCENVNLHKENYYAKHKPESPAFHSETLYNVQYQMDFCMSANHAISDPEFELGHGRISPIPSSPIPSLTKMTDGFDKYLVEGKCMAESYLSEGMAHVEKSNGSNFENFVNLYLMMKVAADILETNGDHFSSRPNVALVTELFEHFPGWRDIYADFTQSFSQLPRQVNQSLQNVPITAETGEDYNHTTWRNGDQCNIELEQINSSLKAYIAQLEIRVDHLTHQLQDMSDKLSGEKKLTAPVLDHSCDCELILEEYEILPYVDETAESKLFYQSEDKRQKPDESSTSASDWEII